MLNNDDTPLTTRTSFDDARTFVFDFPGCASASPSTTKTRPAAPRSSSTSA
jgi:hypothetical protein